MNDDKKYLRQLLSYDFSRLGFTDYQSTDLRILLSLETPELMQEWRNAVSEQDRLYAASLLEMLSLSLVDEAVERDESCVLANCVLDKVRNM